MGELPVCKCPHTIRSTLGVCRLRIEYDAMEAPGLKVLGEITHQHIVPLTQFIIGRIQKTLDK